MLGNGHRLGHEPHTESLPGIGLNINDLDDAVTKVLVLCKALRHCEDGLIHWGHGPAPFVMAGPPGGDGGGSRQPSILSNLVGTLGGSRLL